MPDVGHLGTASHGLAKYSPILLDAAVLNFCERLYQLGEDKRGEFTRAGIETIFDALLHEHSGVANPKTLQLIWRLLGTAFVRANNTCRRVTRDIENQTAKDTIKDQSELRDLRTELACLKQDEKAYNHDVRISRLQYRMAGKQKMIIGEARKVALLYGLLGPKQRTSSRKAKQGQMKRSRAGVRVENRVEPFLWG